MNIGKSQIISILRELGVQYWTEGKNISEDSVNIKCVFCLDDPSNHLGIFEGNGVFSCWRCRKSGPLVYLIRKITGWPEDKCEDLISKSISSFKSDSTDRIKEIINEDDKKVDHKHSTCGLPQYFEKITPGINFPLLYNYLDRRKIVINTLIKYGCGICRVGRYMNRLIIPIISEGRVVCFQAADFTGKAKLKYDSAGNINDFLYNYDEINEGGRIIMVEGVLDVWRIGKDAVATFGTHCTDAQRKLILNKKPEELIFCWDEDAYFRILEYNSEAGFFETFIQNVRIIKFPKDEDPDSYGAKYGEEKLMGLINLGSNQV